MSKNVCKYDNIGSVIQLMDTKTKYGDYNALTSVFTNPTVSWRCGSTKIPQPKCSADFG